MENKRFKVYKFGGASVKDAEGVRNLAKIVGDQKGRLFVVVSAMGKTTNSLELLLNSFYNNEPCNDKLQAIFDYHNQIIKELFGEEGISQQISRLYTELEGVVLTSNPQDYNYEQWYDRIVSYGELICTSIISEYLNEVSIENKWIDMRNCFITSARHRDANIDIEKSSPRLLDAVNSEVNIFIGQGFIGATEEGEPTTIGREGSDYSAAVAGVILEAESVTIWKDVEGILNGDPKIFDNAEYIPELTYLDAIELAYSGAQIIHPKTIKPLQNNSIPLFVKCFSDSAKRGSVIKSSIEIPITIPIFILKRNQVLVTIKPSDFSFVLEERFAQIFALLEKFGVKINLIQSSAISLSLCVDTHRYEKEVIEALDKEGYSISYNTDMELLTIRGYTEEQLMGYTRTEKVYLTQRSRRVLRIVRKS